MQVILEALQARCVEKSDPTLAPFAVQGHHVLCNKHDLARAPDEFDPFRVGPGYNQGEHRAAVRRRNRYPTLPGPEANIPDQAEAELIQIEVEASILIANEDVDRMNPQMGRLPLEPKRRVVIRKG